MQEKVSRKDYRMTRIKIKSNPYTKEIWKGTKDFEEAMARAE